MKVNSYVIILFSGAPQLRKFGNRSIHHVTVHLHRSAANVKRQTSS